MDPSTDVNQDPLNAKDGGATSYSPDFDMSAINEAVAAGGEADNIQNSFDVNDINLNNTPVTDAELQSQLKDNPDMNLAGADVAGSTAGQPESQPSVAAATFVSGDLTDEKPAENKDAETASTVPDFAQFDTSSANFEPTNDLTNEPEGAKEEAAPAEPEEPATIADLANAAGSDVVSGVSTPEAVVPDTATPEAVAPETSQPEKPVETQAAPQLKRKSKTPTLILVLLAVVAVAAVAVAVIVSLG